MIEAFLPQGLTAGSALFLTVASFFTSALTVSAGIGGGIAMLALMGYLMPVASLIPVHGVVQFGSNVGRAFLLRNGIDWKAAGAFMVGAVPGAFAGGQALGFLPDALMRLLLGIFILVITWVKLPKLEGIGPRGFMVTGLMTSFMSMLFGATGPFNAAVLSKAFRLRDRFLATQAAVMTAQHAIKITVFGFAGFAFGPWAALIGAMILTGFAGTYAGRFLLYKLPEERFRLIFNICLTLLALDMVRRGVAGMAQG